MSDLPEPVAQPVQRLRRRGQGLVQLDRIHLLGHRHHGLEQCVELGGHRRHIDHVGTANPFGRRIFRRRECDILVAEHGRRLDVGHDIGRDQFDVLAIYIQRDPGPGLPTDFDLIDRGDPADLHPVVGDLRSRIHRQARPRRDHRQLLRPSEAPAELGPHQHRHEGGHQQQHQPGHLVRRLTGFVQWCLGCGHSAYTVRLKFGSVP